MAENTVDPTGRRGGKSRRELFNEQLTSVAELKKKLSKESAKPTGLEGMEQTAQPVGEVSTSPLAGMLASKRATGYSEQDKNLEAASSEAEGRPSYFDLREGYGHVRRTIRADKAKAWQESFEKLKASSTLGEIRQSPARGVAQSDRDYYGSLIEGHKARGEEVPAALESFKSRLDFNDKVKEFREKGEALPPELEKQRMEMNPQGTRRVPRTAEEKLEAMAAETPIPRGTSHKLIKKSDGSIHVQTYDGADLVSTTPFGIKNVHTVHDVFSSPDLPSNPRNPRTSTGALRFSPVIHRVTTYNSEGVKLSQEETPKYVDTKTAHLVSSLPESRAEGAPKEYDETAYQNLKVQRAGLYRDYGPGSKQDRQSVFDQVSQGNNLAHDKVKQWMERQKPAAVTNFFEKNGTSKHGMSDEALIQWHHTEKAKDAEAKKAKEVGLHNNIVSTIGVTK